MNLLRMALQGQPADQKRNRQQDRPAHKPSRLHVTSTLIHPQPPSKGNGMTGRYLENGLLFPITFI
jgi:hypothetical protein